MSNKFKSNSRFSVLMDEPVKPVPKVKPVVANVSRFTSRKPREVVLSLAEEHFPTLEGQLKSMHVAHSTNDGYANTCRQVDAEQNASTEVPEGWIRLRASERKARTKMPISAKEQPDETTQLRSILTELVQLHQRRTYELIERHGYETWEKMFKCHDWREIQAEREREMEEDTDEETDEEMDEDEEDV